MFPKMTPIGCHYYFISDITYARHSMISNSSFCTSFYNPLVVFWCCHCVYPHLHGISGFSRDSLYVCNSRYYLIRHSHMPQLIKTLKCFVNFTASVHAQVPVTVRPTAGNFYRWHVEKIFFARLPGSRQVKLYSGIFPW